MQISNWTIASIVSAALIGLGVYRAIKENASAIRVRNKLSITP